MLEEILKLPIHLVSYGLIRTKLFEIWKRFWCPSEFCNWLSWSEGIHNRLPVIVLEIGRQETGKETSVLTSSEPEREEGDQERKAGDINLSPLQAFPSLRPLWLSLLSYHISLYNICSYPVYQPLSDDKWTYWIRKLLFRTQANLPGFGQEDSSLTLCLLYSLETIWDYSFSKY